MSFFCDFIWWNEKKALPLHPQSAQCRADARGALAHLVERMHGMHEVVSSSLICSTKNDFHIRECRFFMHAMRQIARYWLICNEQFLFHISQRVWRNIVIYV